MRKLWILLCLFATLTSLPAGASTFDAANDFSATVNSDTSLWSYRYKPGTVRDGNYSLLPGYGPAAAPFATINPGAWTLGGSVPEVGVNQTGSDAPYTTGVVWRKDTMLVHPGNIDLVVVSWLSPSNALVNLNFSFTDLDPNGGNGIAWFVEKNDSATTLSSGAFPNGGESGAVTLTGILVSAGDRINFIVDPNNGDYGYDSTMVTATISTMAIPAGFPTIAPAPQSQIVLAGSNVTFSVVAAGDPPLNYQWRFNGADIAGATNASLVVTNAQITQAGPYLVKVSNSAGSIFSPPGCLAVVSPASQSVTNRIGGVVQFSVLASGTGPFSYQWQFRGTNIGANWTNIDLATNASFLWTNQYSSLAGDFRVVVSNPFGSVTSAALTVPSSPLDFWDVRSSGTYPDLFAITWNEELLVAVGESGAIVTSTDGIAWTNHSVDPSFYLNGITYGNHLFIAVGSVSNGIDISPILSSPDGTNWTPRDSGTRLPLRDVAYGHGLYVAVGQIGTILTSPDGFNWNTLPPPTVFNLNALTFGNGKFVAVGDHFVGSKGETNAIILTSTNGLDWPSISIAGLDPDPKNLRGVGAFPRLFVIAGNDGSILTATNAQDWSGHPFYFGPKNTNLRGVAYGDGTYVVVGNNGLILSSEDAVSWTWRGDGSLLNLHSVVYALHTFFVVGGGAILQSRPLIALSGRQRNDGAGFEVTIAGESMHSYRLQASTNLTTWFDLLTYTNLEPATVFLDPAATNVPQRFYRVTTPP